MQNFWRMGDKGARDWCLCKAAILDNKIAVTPSLLMWRLVIIIISISRLLSVPIYTVRYQGLSSTVNNSTQSCLYTDLI